MSATATADPRKKPTEQAAATDKPVPPEEQFWQRYSPHGELPLSASGSFALHLLGFGMLLLIGIYLASMLANSERSLPVEPVRLKIDGGGGGKRTGTGLGKGVGSGPIENVEGAEQDPELTQDGVDEGPRKPALNPVEREKMQQNFDDSSKRYLSESTSDAVKKFAGLSDAARKKLSDGIRPGQGQGGAGSGGGKGTGTGTGEGPGTGPGKATLSQREKRMLRWNMIFTANSGPEYLAQLRALGAILAFPLDPSEDPKYGVVRDLKPGGQMTEEDVTKLNRIFWIDDKVDRTGQPRGVIDILNALKLRLGTTPKRFVAFMPEKLEAELYRLEKRYVEQFLRIKFNEDQIDETRFRVVPTGRGYRPELIDVTLKRGR